MEPNKPSQGKCVYSGLTPSEAEPQKSLSDYRRVLCFVTSDKRASLIDPAAAAPPTFKSDDAGLVHFSNAPVNCVEACCARSSKFEKELGEEYCQSRRNRYRRRSLLFRFFALLLAAGVFIWHFGPRYLGPGTRNRAPHVHTQIDVYNEGFDEPTCDDLKVFSETYKFGNLKTFTLRNLIETTKHHDQFRKSFVQVLPSKDQREDIVVDFSFKTSSLELQKLLEVKRTDDSLIIEMPSKKLDTQPCYSGCIETQTKVYVRSGLQLEHIEIESRILGISIPTTIDMMVDHAKLVCRTGALRANPLFDSRHTVIRVHSGAVTGSFPLYDLLDIGTHSGAVHIEVLPRPANDEDVQPANLIASTGTGAITVQYNVEDSLPERDYRVSVKSQTGRVGGRLIHGTSTKLESAMGAISATLVPYTADDYASVLTTTTQTGRQSITVLGPYVGVRKPLARLEATHRTASGAVDVHYPKSWEGTVDAVSTTGSVTVTGRDLHIIKERKGVTGRFIEAKKGNGEGTTLCKTETGSVNFRVDWV